MLCAEKLNNTPKMGNIMTVELDLLGMSTIAFIVNMLGEKCRALVRKLENDDSSATTRTSHPSRTLPQKGGSSLLRSSENSTHHLSNEPVPTVPDRTGYVPAQIPKSETLNACTHSGLSQTPNQSSRTSQPSGTSQYSSEDPLDVRIRNLLHSGKLTKSEVKSLVPKDPLLPGAFSEKQKTTPLLACPSYAIPTITALPLNDRYGIGDSENRRTLLPTPQHELPPLLQCASKKTLLKTPSTLEKSYRAVTQLAYETSMRFVNELRDVVQKDLERRFIEGHAFREIALWWDSSQTVSFLQQLIIFLFVCTV